MDHKTSRLDARAGHSLDQPPIEGTETTETTSTLPYRAFGTYRLLLAVIVVCSHSGWILQDTELGSYIIGARLGWLSVIVAIICMDGMMQIAIERPISKLRDRVRGQGILATASVSRGET